eukprot:c3931_g1_i1.p1 GENE.c3931_g1_i1~~c3931_g1_i1.p1  ORF type:complete len:1270 (+),score=363.00 c3931_g1_i1:173-3982(+)
MSKKGSHVAKEMTTPTTVEPVEEEDNEPAKPLFRFAETKDWVLIIAGFAIMAVGGAAIPGFSYIFGRLINNLYGTDRSKSADNVQILASSFFGIGGGLWLVFATGIACWVTTSARQTLKIRKAYIRALFRQDVGWFDLHGMDTAVALLSETNKFQEGISDKFATAIYFEGCFICGLVFGFVQGWQLTLVILGCIPALGVAGFFAFKLMGGSKAKNPYEKASTVATEYLSAIRTVQSFSLQEVAVEKYTEMLEQGRKFKLKGAMTAAFTIGFVWFALFCAYAVSLWYGSNLIVTKTKNVQTGNAWTGGDVLSVFFSVLVGGMSVGQAGPGLQSFKEGKDASKKIWKTIDRVPTIDIFNNEGDKTVNLSQPITFEKVHFSYPTAKDVEVLKGLTFTVNPGEFVALVGPSGSGKSTVAHLLERFYDPTLGNIKLGDTDWRTIDVKHLRANIGIVSQEPVLFNRSIADNIRFSKPNATQAEVEAAAKLANAHEFIESLPRGYNTRVGEAGTQMSGGQKQRIAIARAVLQQPKLLILDEATSALDTQSERVVQEALEKIMQGRTIIAVAHRLSTIAHANKILVISAGVLHEQGSHTELMQVNGIYAGLIRQQHLTSSSSSLTRIGSAVSAILNDELGAADTEKKVVDLLDLMPDEEAEKKQPKLSKEFLKRAKRRTYALIRPVWYWAVLGFVGASINGAIMPCFSLVFTEMLKIFYECIPTSCTTNASGFCYHGFETEHECFGDLKIKARFMALMFVVLAGGGLVANFLAVYSFHVIGQHMTLQLRRTLFRTILFQDIAWFDLDANSTGSLSTRLASETENVNEVVSFSAGINLQNIVTLATGLAIAFSYGWELALIMIAMVPLVAGAGVVQFKTMSGGNREKSTLREHVGRDLLEAAKNFRTVCACNAQEVVIDTVSSHLQEQYKKSLQRSVMGGILFGLSMFVIFSMYGVAFSMGAYLIRTGRRSPDDILKVFFGLAMAAMGMGQAGGLAPDASKFNSSILNVYETMDRAPPINCHTPGRDTKVDGVVDFNNTSFSYPTRSNVKVMDSLNLSIPSGKRIAFVGPSGSGKSTVVRLLQRFYDPSEGQVEVEKVDIKEFQLMKYRKQIGIVEQEPILFTASIRENIRFGRLDATDEEVEKAAREANAHEFIIETQNKYDTMIGTGHSQLSGGQKQRVAIARALIRNPTVLLLDEATSALDSKSEKVVNDVLASCSKGRTTLVIAHRLSTIQDADEIIVVDKGKMVERGTHDGLVEKDGVYASLVRQQQLEGSGS